MVKTMNCRSKYGNRKITYNGETYDSIKEYRRHDELKLLQRAGKISSLERQVKFELIPSQKIGGKVVERSCSYIADFVYVKDGETIVEDVKSEATKTPEYIVKRKLMLFIKGIRIQEV